MPAQVHEEAIDLAVGLVEDQPVSGSDACYPLPRLRATGQVEVRAFGAVVLENEFVRAMVVPALGGRLLSFRDKRTDTELVSRPSTLTLQPGGIRDVELRAGIEITLNGTRRPNAMGPVAYQLEPAEDEEEAAGVWLAETSFHGGLGFHARFWLLPDEAGLHFEVRVSNRTFQTLPYNGGLIFEGAEGLAFAPDRDCPFDGDGLRFAEPRQLGPRQVDSWSGTLIPFEGPVSAVGSGFAMHLGPDKVRVQSISYAPEHKLVLLTAEGKSLEAPVDLVPTEAMEIPIEGVQAVALALLNDRKQEILRTDEHAPSVSMTNTASLDPDAGLAALRRRAFEPALRGPARSAMGRYWLQQGAWESSALAFEDALLYSGDDPLAWWGFAASLRLAGSDESGPRLNAHYLAPLEPLLRAEAFLGQSMEMTAEPNPLVAPVARIPEDLVEVACVLIDHGLLDQANRWIDEALRHRNLAMLHYLMAYILLRGTRLDAEAAQHVAKASRALLPPLPWRPVEREAIRVLHERFPDDRALGELVLGSGF